MRDDAVARVLDVVEERAARGHVVDRAGEGVDVGARIELDRIEHLLGRDVARRARDEAAAHLGRNADRAHHAEVDDDGRRAAACAPGSRCLSRVEPLAARERKAEPEVGRLDVAMHEAGAVERGEPGARLEDDLPQLEERHRARGRVLLQIGADQVLEHEERHVRRRRRDR